MHRCLLQAKNFPTNLWVEAIYYPNYLLKHILTKVVNPMTPVKKWCGKNILVDHLRVFIFVAWAHIPDDCKKKLDAKSHAYIMMGYVKESKSYLLFDLIKQQIIIKRNVFLMKYSGIKLLNTSYSTL
jgi:hypothetical protein